MFSAARLMRKSLSPLKLCFCAAVAPLAAVLAGGCVERGGVHSYTVENLSGERVVEPAAQPGSAWFFKMQGSPDSVLAQAEPFAQIVASVEFGADGMPTWTTPTGWTSTPETGLRFATLKLDGSDPPLELAVSTLTAPDPGGDAYLKMNINRWRGQVGLEPYQEANWKQAAEGAGELRTSESDGRPVYLVQLSGTNQEGQPSTILGAIMPLPGSTPPSAVTPESTAAAPPATSPSMPTYTAPAEWTEATPGQFQLALWTVTSGDDQIDISLSSVGGSVDANLARWAGQVGLPPTVLAEASEPITVGGRSAVRVELVGSEKTILGVVVPDESASWFFKLIGPNALAAGERERFDQFIGTVKF
jgi:hypothetical protein